MCFSSPSTPAVTPIAAAPTATAQESDPVVQEQRATERSRRLAAANANSTLVTGGAGVTEKAHTGLKTSFGA